ncbi:Glutaredoxin-like protein, YruB-family [Bacillus sp. OV322]|uniref:glutaredoxin domain-containing protein n=1 Tax=Bacillus sp. OV322 TaxID=1882764 RepID=UPI0008EAD43A|nr:glutaredoxin domain-containing protein [Bacillus sp. OV322]SFC03351.1 Glutaredoxin-like protein, YruB-family [Bacillus sp. OV322]
MNDIILFTQPDCPPCKIMKMFLQENQISFIEKNIKEDAASMKELTKKYGSYSTPTIVINGQAIIGFEIDKIKETLSLA